MWYRLKNAKNGKVQSTAPHLEELPSSPAPPNPIIMGSMTYEVDPPGYTEKNAYFGITSPLSNYITLSPSAREKGRALL